MVFEFGADILEWNAKVLHYVGFFFIFTGKFLSQSGTILLFHSDDLWILKQIREVLDNYSMSIQMKWVVVNSLLLCNIEDLGLKVHLPFHIFSLFIMLLVFYYNPQHFFLLL
jgi:hypothetical protein